MPPWLDAIYEPERTWCAREGAPEIGAVSGPDDRTSTGIRQSGSGFGHHTEAATQRYAYTRHRKSPMRGEDNKKQMTRYIGMLDHGIGPQRLLSVGLPSLGTLATFLLTTKHLVKKASTIQVCD